MKLDSKTFNLKKTIDKTFEQNKNTLLQKEPSAMREDQYVLVDVRFLGDKIPEQYNDTTLNQHYHPNQMVDYTKLPVWMDIRRGHDRIRMTRTPLQPDNPNTDYSYALSLHSRGLNYCIVQTPQGKVSETGNSLLLDAFQYDADFSKFVHIVAEPKLPPQMRMRCKQHSR